MITVKIDRQRDGRTSEICNAAYQDGRTIKQHVHDVSGLVCLCVQYDSLVCDPCSPGCVTCDDVTPCTDVIMTRVVLLGVQVFTMIVSVAVGVAVVRLRRTKVRLQ